MSQLKTNWLVEKRNVLFPLAPLVGEYNVCTLAGQLDGLLAVHPATLLTCDGRQVPSVCGANGPTPYRVFAFKLVTRLPLLSCSIHLAVTDFPRLKIPEYELVLGGSAVANGE